MHGVKVAVNGCTVAILILNTNPNPTFHYDLRKHFFTAHIVNIWNSFPNSVVDANSVNAFKARLDKFWLHYCNVVTVL